MWSYDLYTYRANEIMAERIREAEGTRRTHLRRGPSVAQPAEILTRIVWRLHIGRRNDHLAAES